MEPRNRRQGYTLIELMVALGVLAIVTAQLFVVFTTQKKAYITNERILDVQEDARLVVDLLVSEARMAGFMVQRMNGISSLDAQGGNGSDTLCVSDPSVMNETQVTNASQKFAGGSITAIDGSGARITVASLAAFDIDGDGGVDFDEGRGIVLSDGTNTHCARVTDVDTAGLDLEFEPDIEDTAPWNAGAVRIVPAVVYEVEAGVGLRRNNMLLSAEVEDLQAEFGVDVNLDDVVDETDPAEFPLDTLQGSNPARVRSVRLSVVTRTSQNDPDYGGPGHPEVANNPAGPDDGFRRRRFVASVLPRNLL
jgi:prepilin-type N-terminal cleavage/methylation domain-containing protein